MGLKSFFIAEDGNEKKKEEKVISKDSITKFPSSKNVTESIDSDPFSTTFPNSTSQTNTPVSVASIVTPTNLNCEPHLSKLMKVYEDGFNSLNQDGYDFFEFYKTVIQVGLDNPSVYNMAFTMAKAIDSKVSKQTLLNQSKFYVDEITKVHSQYVTNGTSVRQETLKEKESEENLLRNELNNFTQEIVRLTTLKNQTEAELQKIDTKYLPKLTEIDCKIMANDVAKESLLNSINSVISGINMNIN